MKRTSGWRTGLRIGLVAALVALAAGSSAVAQTQVEVQPPAGEMGSISDLPVKDGVVQVSLEDAIRVALERNLGLIVERYRYSESDYRLEGSRGIYDLGLSATALAWEEESPAASNLDGAQVQIQENQALTLGLRQLISTGGSLSLSFDNSRFDTNSTFATLNPSFRLDLDLGYSQPLLRNRGRKVTERGIRVARINREISRETFETQVLSVIQLVEQAYWDLVEARAQFEVAQESLSLARELHEQNRIRVDVGTLAPLELVQSEAGIASREEQLIRAESAIGDAQDRVRQLMNVPSDERWDTPFEPTTEPETPRMEIDLQTAMETALERRPDLRAQRLTRENVAQDVLYYKNQALPRLDLNVTYGTNGLGGDVTNRDFFTGEILSTETGNYGDALQQIAEAGFQGWRISLDVAYPMQNRAANAQRSLSEIGLDRQDAQLRDLELSAKTQVRRLARAVDTAQQALESARVSRRLEERNLEAEQKRYDNGMSTSFQVLQIQEDLTEARQREVNALTGLRKAIALYYQSTGELLEKSQVEIVEAE